MAEITGAVGTTVSVSAAAPVTFDADGYGALTWDEVGEIVDVDEFGIENAITEYNRLDDPQTRKVYGNQNNAVLSCRALMRAGNTGQDTLAAGPGTRRSFTSASCWPTEPSSTSPG